MSLKPARLLMADPPWHFGDTLPGRGRGAAKHYPCMTVEEICAYPLPPLADDCLLLLWRVAAMQEEALRVVREWGFTLKSEIIWEKLTKNGKQHFGMGHYVRVAHEVCLIGVRGRVKVADRAVRSSFSAPVGIHSQKPDEIYAIAERLSAGPYVELFARRSRKGWQQFGNQLVAT